MRFSSNNSNVLFFNILFYKTYINKNLVINYRYVRYRTDAIIEKAEPCKESHF